MTFLDKRLCLKDVHLIIFNNPVQTERILIISAKESGWNLERAFEIVARHYAAYRIPETCNRYLVKGRLVSFDWSCIFSTKSGRLWKQPLCCMATWISGKQHHCLVHWYMLPVFQPLINRIIHHPMTALNPGLNMLLPQLVRGPTSYPIILWLTEFKWNCWLVTYIIDERGVAQQRSLKVSWASYVGALSCWKTNTSPANAMLHTTDNSPCISNTSW